MSQGNFIFCTRHNMFDVRHYMIVGCSLMTAVLVLVSQTNLQAHVIDPDADFARTGQPAVSKTARTARTPKPFVIPEGFQLKIFGQKKNVADQPKLTRLASLGTEASVIEFSPKTRESCSLDVARAAARGDTSKISPCITALLSGDEDEFAKIPEKAAATFIEIMNSDNPGENMVQFMMGMMGAMTNTTESDTPEKTASTDE